MSTKRPTHDEVTSATAETARAMVPQKVPVNAYATPGAFVIIAPFPAVTERDVWVELTDGAVRMWGELRSAGPREYVIHEWEFGGYERTVETPRGYGADVDASLTNGQLVVRVLSGEYSKDRLVQPASG
jgi:HSP20 family molecular chaperone IbpA